MKKLPLDIGFGAGFVLLCIAIEYIWGKATLPQLHENALLAASVKAGMLYSISKIAFSFYITYYTVDKIIRREQKLSYSIIEILLALLVCVVADRLIANLLVVPYAYHYAIEQAPIFEPRRVILVILFAVFLTGIMLGVKSISSLLVSKEREKNLIKDKLEAELRFLKNQTNPHFLLNTLYNIYALARKGSVETAEVVMRLAELLRFMLYESQDNLISLNDEIKVLEDYLGLEMIRYDKRLSVNFNKQVGPGQYMITPLLLLPLLENAFKHGLSETRFESFINVDIIVKDGYLNLEIENTYDLPLNGIKKNNIGLANARRQLELTYKEHKLEISNCNSIFKVALYINLNSYAEI
jgi:two-component system, LytTR family, sensor kinase